MASNAAATAVQVGNDHGRAARHHSVPATSRQGALFWRMVGRAERAAKEAKEAKERAVTEASWAAEERLCPVCIEHPRGVVFTCGHLVCAHCAPGLEECPNCRATVTARIPVFL